MSTGMILSGRPMRDRDEWKIFDRLHLFARVKHLLANSGDRDHVAKGTPVSAAHPGFFTAVIADRKV